MAKGIEYQNKLLNDTFLTLVDHQEQKVAHQKQQFLKTKGCGRKIDLATQNIKKIQSNLKHHILSSKYDIGKDANPLREKYIDLTEGKAMDLQLIGDTYLEENTKRSCNSDTSDEVGDSDEENKRMKQNDNFVGSVPILLRFNEA